MSTGNTTTETEVKLYTPNFENIQEKLKTLGAILEKPRVYERNVRYENAERTLTETGIVVRLREDTKIRLTYKSAGDVENGIISRFEAEVEVSDFQTMETILENLGYFPHMVYEKYRTTYTLNNAEIVLDEMPYGNFTEVEGDVKTIESVLIQLGLQAAPRYGASYAVLFNIVKKNLNLDFQDLTFENFADITVQAEHFKPKQSI